MFLWAANALKCGENDHFLKEILQSWPGNKPLFEWMITQFTYAYAYRQASLCSPQSLTNGAFSGIIILADFNSYLPECKKSAFGRDYHGTLNVAVNGATCQRWDSVEPHQHSYYARDSEFPWDGNVEVNNIPGSFQYQDCLSMCGITVIRRSWDRFIFMMWIPKTGKTISLYRRPYEK